MLCVRKVTFIDRAEPEALWSHNLKKQWSYGDLIAVRVRDSNERVLGSTIPMPFVAAQEGETEWGVSWIDEDRVEEPEQPVENADAELSAAIEEPHGAMADPALSDHPQEVAEPENSSALSHPIVQAKEQPSPTSPQSPEAPHTPAATAAAAGAAVTPASANASASEVPLPSSAAPVDAAESSAEAEETNDGPVNDASVGFGAAAASNAAAAAAAAAPSLPHSPSSPATASDAAGAAPVAPAPQRSPSASGAPSLASPVNSPTGPLPVERRPSFSSCIPISIAQAARGPLFFDVITASGTKLAVTEANVQAVLNEDVAGSALVRHYAIVLTPLKMMQKQKQEGTVYAVLEFSVVVGSTDADDAILMAAGARYTAMPTTLAAGTTCSFSTCTFYFPPTFLTGTGEYIVTNVLCVESLSDNPVRLEVALPEDLKRVGVLPDKKAVISRRGGRAVFTFTWNVFDAYVDLDAVKDTDGERSTAGLHVLIRDGTENKAPVDIALVGGLPSPTEENTGPYMFYVNHAKVANIACSKADDVLLADILPISLVTRAGV